MQSEFKSKALPAANRGDRNWHTGTGRVRHFSLFIKVTELSVLMLHLQEKEKSSDYDFPSPFPCCTMNYGMGEIKAGRQIISMV